MITNDEARNVIDRILLICGWAGEAIVHKGLIQLFSSFHGFSEMHPLSHLLFLDGVKISGTWKKSLSSFFGILNLREILREAE
jgi:hypothetical protein